MSTIHIAVIVGSIRKDSLNQKLADALAKLAPPEFSFKNVRIDDLPLYNQDDDANQAASVQRLKADISASQGLLFMAEAVYNASGLGLPIVMTVANRAIGAPINIWNDHSDSMSQRDCGWIQLFAAHNQEALDLHIQAFKLAEELSMPVMVCMDGFILTHAYERVDMPSQADVDAFLPPYEPRQVLDPAEPVSIGAMVGPEAFMEVRYLAHAKQLQALVIPETFEVIDWPGIFGVKATPLREALDLTFNHPVYSKVTLTF